MNYILVSMSFLSKGRKALNLCELLESRDCRGNTSCSVSDKLLLSLDKSPDSQCKLYLQGQRKW